MSLCKKRGLDSYMESLHRIQNSKSNKESIKHLYRNGVTYIQNMIYENGRRIAYKLITANPDQAFYKKDGSVGTALRSNWQSYVNP